MKQNGVIAAKTVVERMVNIISNMLLHVSNE